MERFSLLDLLARRWVLIIAVTLIAGLAAWFSVGFRPVSFEVSIPVLVGTAYTQPLVGGADSSTNLTSAASEDARFASTTTLSWMADPSFASDVYSRAGIAPADTTVRGLSKAFKPVADDQSSASYQVQFAVSSTENATKLATAMNEIAQQRVDSYNALQGNGVAIRMEVGTPLTSEVSPRKSLVPLAGLLIGFIFALTLAALAERRS